MEIKHLQTFVEVVRLNSFTKAADRLCLTQPTISSQISKLEQELNAPLLLRTTKSLQVTPRGRELYDYAIGILNITEKIYQRCSAKQECRIHIGASTIPSTYILPQIITGFCRLHPEVTYELHQSDSRLIINSLLDGVYDIGFIGMPCSENSIECVRFYSDNMIAITPSSDKFKKLKSYDLRAVLSEPIILREAGSGSLKGAEPLMNEAGLSEEDLNVIARTNDSEAIKQMVISGVGVSVISDLAVKEELKNGSMLAFSPDKAPAARDFFMITRKDIVLPAYAREFAEYVLSCPKQ